MKSSNGASGAGQGPDPPQGSTLRAPALSASGEAKRVAKEGQTHVKEGHAWRLRGSLACIALSIKDLHNLG